MFQGHKVILTCGSMELKVKGPGLENILRPWSLMKGQYGFAKYTVYTVIYSDSSYRLTFNSIHV